MPRAAISGTGLIGASIGLALGRADWEVVGWDPDAEMLKNALDRGAMQEGAATLDDLLDSKADLIVLSGPPGVVTEQAAEIESDALVIDVAGVKSAVVEAARPSRFVGTHPMAGREVRGPQSASPALFRGATWVVVTDGATESDLVEVEAILDSLGARHYIDKIKPRFCQIIRRQSRELSLIGRPWKILSLLCISPPCAGVE